MYEPSNGRFDHLDPFFGDKKDPQSFHKYGYVHGDPVNNIDPTGEAISIIVAGAAAGAYFFGSPKTAHAPAPDDLRQMTFKGGDLNTPVDNIRLSYLSSAWFTLPGWHPALATIMSDSGIGDLRVKAEGNNEIHLSTIGIGVNLKGVYRGTAGGENRKVLKSELKKSKFKYVGVTGLGTCVGVIIITPGETEETDSIIVSHIQPGTDAGVETLRALGPYPEGSTMVIAGATVAHDRRSSEYQIYELQNFAKENGIAILGFLNDSNIYVNSDGHYTYRKDHLRDQPAPQ